MLDVFLIINFINIFIALPAIVAALMQLFYVRGALFASQ